MRELIDRLVRKAEQSDCRYKVGAMGLNRRGEVVGLATNQHRFARKGGTVHAELHLMRKAGPSLRKIIICRIGTGGRILPIDPCCVCAEKAAENGIEIIPLNQIYDEYS
jgi:hypothetical protein